MHRSSHQVGWVISLKGVYSMLAQKYRWDSMYEDVHAYCRSCLTCSSYQGTGRRVKPPLMPIPVGGPFHHVGVDIMELPQTMAGNHYVISFIAIVSPSGLSDFLWITKQVRPLWGSWLILWKSQKSFPNEKKQNKTEKKTCRDGTLNRLYATFIGI